MKQKFYKKKRYSFHAIRPCPDRLVEWSIIEEILLRQAIRESMEFFKIYGKGREPYAIDYRHYANSCNHQIYNNE